MYNFYACPPPHLLQAIVHHEITVLLLQISLCLALYLCIACGVIILEIYTTIYLHGAYGVFIWLFENKLILSYTIVMQKNTT